MNRIMTLWIVLTRRKVFGFDSISDSSKLVPVCKSCLTRLSCIFSSTQFAPDRQFGGRHKERVELSCSSLGSAPRVKGSHASEPKGRGNHSFISPRNMFGQLLQNEPRFSGLNRTYNGKHWSQLDNRGMKQKDTCDDDTHKFLCVTASMDASDGVRTQRFQQVQKINICANREFPTPAAPEPVPGSSDQSGVNFRPFLFGFVRHITF